MGSQVLTDMFGIGRRSLWALTIVWLVIGCADSSPSTQPLPRFTRVYTLGPGTEWRFNPLIIDIDGDGWYDLAANTRLVAPALHLWRGDGSTFTPITPTWTDIGYAALATGDINHDGFPDIVGASHFGKVQTLLRACLKIPSFKSCDTTIDYGVYPCQWPRYPLTLTAR
jgi:FG-GAP-like repeat